MASTSSFRSGSAVTRRPVRWKQSQIDEVERAKERQRQREQEQNRQRNADASNR